MPFVNEMLKIKKSYLFYVNVALFVSVLLVCQCFYFGINHRLSWFFYLLAIPCAVFSGCVLAGFELFSGSIRKKNLGRFRRTIIGFISFFVYLVSYSVIIYLFMSYPLGMVLVRGDGGEVLRRSYVLFSTNLGLLLSLFAWSWWLWCALEEAKK